MKITANPVVRTVPRLPTSKPKDPDPPAKKTKPPEYQPSGFLDHIFCKFILMLVKVGDITEKAFLIPLCKAMG